MSRARHEARWTHEDATVSQRYRRNVGWWALLAGGALVIGLALFGYSRWWNMGTVTYETMHCTEPVSAGSSWDQVMAAGCEPVDTAAVGRLEVFNQLDRSDETSVREPASTQGAVTTYDDIAVNSPAHFVRIQLDQPVRSVALAVPDDQEVRRDLSSDASDTVWSTNVGSRAERIWLLITP